MSSSDWFRSARDTIVQGLAPAAQAEALAYYDGLAGVIAGMSSADLSRARNIFVADLVDQTTSSVLATLDLSSVPGLESIASRVTGAVGAARAALIGALADALAPLTSAARELREAAAAAWTVAHGPARAARALRTAEKAAALAAMATGLPPVTAAWAGAYNARAASIVASDAAAKVATVADLAWAAVQRIVDMLRSTILDLSSHVSDLVSGAMNGLATATNILPATAFAGADARLRAAINLITEQGA